MNRTITVKGTGSVSRKPDQIVVNLDIEALKKDYDQTVADAAKQYQQLQAALEKIGFDREEIKTARYSISPKYELYENKKERRNVRALVGYACEHQLRISFDYDMKRLSSLLSTVAALEIAEPEMHIRFTLKDEDAVCEELLRSAAENARRKAEILADASGARLGQLVTVHYNWDELEFYSSTNYERHFRMCGSACDDLEITPEDIHLSDTAAFVWELE